jgi:hypothetical protein
MILKDLLEKDFGVALPISGGTGNSIENAIIIHRVGINDYVGTEHFILKCLGKGRRIIWRFLGQELLSHNNKIIDKIKIETKEETESEIITQIENYYFDITECFGNDAQQEISFNDKETLSQIKKRILELETLNDFNKECIRLLRKEELFKDSKLTLKFIDILFKDESLPLFESMMKNEKKSIMEVLRIIGNELNKYNLIDNFFIDQEDYIKFLVGLKQRTIANDEATCFAELTKEDGCFWFSPL